MSYLRNVILVTGMFLFFGMTFGYAKTNPRVEDCNNTFSSSAKYIVPPATTNVRFFANGEILVVHLNTFGEPAGGASRLLVRFLLTKPTDEKVECKVISWEESVAFSDILMEELHSEYNPSVGLILQVPILVYSGQGDIRHSLRVTINRSTNELTAVVND